MQWRDLNAATHRHVTVAGYDLRHDFRAIVATFPFVKDMLTERMQNVIDLYRLLQSVSAYLRTYQDNPQVSYGVSFRSN